jgi:hypothetical protein
MKQLCAKFLHGLCGLAAVAALTACGTRPTGFHAVERELPTRGGLVGDTGMFHDIVYNPESIALSFPGYIIGVDKARRSHVREPQALADFTRETENDEWGITLFKRRLARDPKLHYISHIVRNEGRRFGEGNCLLFTIYRHWGAPDPTGKSLPAEERDHDLEDNAGCDRRPPTYGEYSKAFDGSRTALEVLRDELKKKSGYTHALVVVMGWNTPQIEAVRNYNAIASHIRAAAAAEGKPFEPLFIGLTWSSTWSSQWVDAAVKALSYPAKADDADEVGLTWLAESLAQVRSVIPHGIPTVAIGHSFGARSLASALCKGSQIKVTASGQPQPAAASQPWDLFIGWQPAVSIHRFSASGSADGFRYVDGCPGVRSIFFTASRHDEAVDTNFWADFLGSEKSWRSACDTDKRLANPVTLTRKVNCLELRRNGGGKTLPLALRAGEINYVDSSDAVWFNQPNTGGGAHSDVYRAVHGRISWEAITKLASPGSDRMAAQEQKP